MRITTMTTSMRMRSTNTITIMTITTTRSVTTITITMNTRITMTTTTSATIPTAPATTITTHADEVFTSWGKETPKVFAQADIERILTALDSGDYGKILRAKGIVNGEGGKWIEFDFVPEEHEVRAGHPDYTGRLCVIGAELQEDKLSQLFGL